MQASGSPNVYIALGAGFAIWLIGQRWGGKRALGQSPPKCGRFLSVAGLAVIAVGVLAGFKGPLTIAGVTLERFPFSRMIEQADSESLAYATKHLDISRAAAVGWHGAMKSALKYTVRNNGDTEIRRLTVRLATTDGASVELPLYGPFPAKKTGTSIVEVPPNVDRSYFKGAKAQPGEIVGARF